MNRFSAIITLVLCTQLNTTTWAQEKIWVGGTPGAMNAWEIGQNWLDGNVPTAFDDVFIDQEGSTHALISMPDQWARKVFVGQTTPGQLDISTLGSLEAESFALGGSSGSVGTMNVRGKILTSPVASSSLTVGATPSSAGEFNLTGSGSFSGMNAWIGEFGTGTMLVSGGTSFDASDLTVGFGGSSVGTVTQTGGNITLVRDYLLGSEENAMGIVHQSGGTTTVAGVLKLTDTSPNSRGIYHLSGGMLDMNGGPIEFNAGDATFNFTDGTLHDVGTFGSDLHQMGGTVTPGDGVGTMIIQGNFVQDPGATYMLHLDGSTQSSDFIRVEGSAILNGSITPVVLSRFPVIGNDTPYTFTVLTATDGITETTHAPLLSKLELPPIGHVSKGLFVRDYQTIGNSVVASYFQATEGDTDGDSDVDITDFNVLAANYDPHGLNQNDWPEGDFDQTVTVDITDFNVLSQNFAPLGYGDGGIVIPEPTSGGLLLLALLTIHSCRLHPTRRATCMRQRRLRFQQNFIAWAHSPSKYFWAHGTSLRSN